MATLRVPWLIVATLLGGASATEAVVFRVPSEYPTINAGLDAAAAGDSVLVAPGTYSDYESRQLIDGFWYEAVGFLRSDVTLLSEAGAASTTLRLDASVSSPQVLYALGEPGVATVIGFTITGTTPRLDGATFGHGGRLVIRDCVFRDLGTGLPDEVAAGTVRADLEVYGCLFQNINGAVGSAINQTSGTLILEDSEFVNCRDAPIRLDYDFTFPHPTSAVVRRCRFQGNLQTKGGGAALNVANYESVIVENCWFEGNRTVGPSSTGAVLLGGLQTVSLTVQDNTFVSNSAGRGPGGGLWVAAPNALVAGNTFWGNGIDLNWSTGGAAVFFELGGELRNNVIVGSTGDEAVGMFSGTVQTSCNVFWANPVGDAAFPLSATDLPADPQFCAPESQDFRVNSASPCLPGHGHPACTEAIGAWGEGCGTIGVAPFTWGRVKGQFRNESEGRK